MLLRNGTSYHEDRELGTKRARAAILMELALPGSAYIYQGEELGLPEVADIPWDELEDPTAFNRVRDQIEKGRDGCRVPLPWKAGTPTFGFSPPPSMKAPAWTRARWAIRARSRIFRNRNGSPTTP